MVVIWHVFAMEIDRVVRFIKQKKGFGVISCDLDNVEASHAEKSDLVAIFQDGCQLTK